MYIYFFSTNTLGTYRYINVDMYIYMHAIVYIIILCTGTLSAYVVLIILLASRTKTSHNKYIQRHQCTLITLTLSIIIIANKHTFRLLI